jgi:polar amino acid transport system substrate-binding protein
MNLELDRRTFLKRVGQASGLVVAGGTIESILAACGGNVSTTTSSGTTPGATKIASNGLKVPGLMQWGATSSGGAPYVFQDPANPNNKVGFEEEIAQAMAALMGVTQKQIEQDYSTMATALLANQFDFVMNGWEITPDRQQTEVFSQPYYRYGQQIVVRANDARFSQYTTSSVMSLTNLEGYKVGTGAAYKAADILKSDAKIDTKTFDPDLPFDALTQKNLDAVLIDLPIVAYYVLGAGPGGTPNPALKPIGKPFDTSDYVIGFNKSNPNSLILLKEIDQALTQLKKDGTLQKIYKKWSMWNDQQAAIGIM